MNAPKNEADTKKTGLRPEPLCMFCFPEQNSSIFFERTTYVNALPKKEPEGRLTSRRTVAEETHRDQRDVKDKAKEDLWLRKRTEARIRRRRMKEPIRNLRTYLLASMKSENVPQKTILPSLYEVLETVKDAWPAPQSSILSLERQEDQKTPADEDVTPKDDKMKEKPLNIQLSTLLNRRLSVPEELMRKYSVSKERTSEESEANKTAVEITSSSSSTIEPEVTARRRDLAKTGTEPEEPRTGPEVPSASEANEKIDASQQTDKEETPKNKITELPKRVTQNDFYSQGKRIIKVKAGKGDGCTCRNEKQSSSTASAKEETDDSATTESMSSSSPTQLPKQESSSDNLSSESDCRCTCAEITSSKETSTDPFHSGKSTLSQTISEKSTSTQDSTVSVISVSTRGTTASDNNSYYSSTPELYRTSAKETTTSPEYSPRTPRINMNRKNRRKDRHAEDHKKTCPRYREAKHSRGQIHIHYGMQCPIHSDNKQNIETNQGKNEVETQQTTQNTKNIGQPAEHYKWAKLSQEELYMMQQLRHQKFIESQRRYSTPSPLSPDTSACLTETPAYKETKYLDEPIMIPRYSALPRTLSMLVNTSSAEKSVPNSDSDNQSLADSLEEQPITHIHKLYYDTKKELKPVRGDVNIVPETNFKRRQPKGRAFFISIKDPYGEDEMLEHIEKIPQPPEKIKNKIFKRHLDICTKHKKLHQAGTKTEQKTKKEASLKRTKARKTEEGKKADKTNRVKKHNESEKKDQVHKTRTKSMGATRKDDDKNTRTSETHEDKVKNKKEEKDKRHFNSKIPIPVSGRSTSSSPEREVEVEERIRPKTRVRREKHPVDVENSPEMPTVREVKPTQTSDVETTQILEITRSGSELTLNKPQAVIHPSHIPNEPERPKDLLTIPPLVSSFGTPFRQTWNKQLLPARRSPVGKFRQRFEVIPEEKSSSLSSAEEKTGKELPKFADASTSPPLDDVQFQSYNITDVPNLIVAKIKNKQLETLPYVNDNQIILFSSKEQNSNSTKGRDALIAMNREDFQRLAKGWMNFYKLNENYNSESEEKCGKNKDGKDRSKTIEGGKQKNDKAKSEGIIAAQKQVKDNSTKQNADFVPPEECDTRTKCLKNPDKEVKESTVSGKTRKSPEIDENIRFHSSNTILRAVKSIPQGDDSRFTGRQSSLPEVKPPNQRELGGFKTKTSVGSLPRVSKHEDTDTETDSDSTDYMELPSPRVPPLHFGEFPSDATLSSSDSELDEGRYQLKTLPPKYFQLKKRIPNKIKSKNESFDSTHFGKKKNSEWSVTVAGTVELSRSAPDLEMRLSFPTNGGPPIVSQSDSGFADDSNYSKFSESLRDLDLYTSRKDLPLGVGNMKQKWTVTVKNPKQGGGQDPTKPKVPKKNPNNLLPNLESSQNRNTKKVLKETQMQETLKRIIERKLLAIWPKVQRAIQKEFLSHSGRLITEPREGEDEEFALYLKGSAISLERKEKPLTMTERDVTRRYTSRTNPPDGASKAEPSKTKID